MQLQKGQTGIVRRGMENDELQSREKKLRAIRNIFFRSSVEDLWFDILKGMVNENHDVLEIGSGSGKGKQNKLYPSANKIVGIDLDERVLQNPYLDQAYCINAYKISDVITDAKFDFIYSHMVAEHIDDAKKFITCQVDLLKDGGVLFHSTVSNYYWTSIINDFVPVSIKNYLIKSLGSGRTADDVFPAHYLLNSESDIRKICDDLNLLYEITRQDEPPGYLRRSYALMLIYTAIHKPLQFIFPSLRPTFIFKIFSTSHA